MTDKSETPGAEDVLSSIRRLVSDGERRGPTPATPAREAAPAEDPGSAEPRLVLTDALRVAGDGSDHTSAPQAPEPAPSEDRAAEPDDASLAAALGPVVRSEIVQQLGVSKATPGGAPGLPTAATTAEEGAPTAEGRVIPEAELRAAVAALVRQELQGPLGERITRNVRKLVRREIHRVLLSGELE